MNTVVPRRAPWHLRRRPYPDETLTSWLIANARLNGGQLHTFCTLSFGAREIWTRDIDLHATDPLLERAAEMGGLSIEEVKALTLRQQLSQIQPVGANHAKLHSPWLMPLGIRHRSRTRHGTQFCAECLIETGAFVRSWRWSFMVVCDREDHENIGLQDCCPHCFAAVVPHRAPHGDVTRCHHCAGDLTHLVCTSECSSSEDLQWLLLSVLRGGDADYERIANSNWHAIAPKSRSDGQKLFIGLRTLLAVLRQPRIRHLLIEGGYELPDVSGSIERMRRHHRVAWLSVLADAVGNGEHGLVRFLEPLGLTQRSFKGIDYPDWMRSAIGALPPGIALANRQGRASLYRILKQLALTHPRHSTAYREQRAALVLDNLKANEPVGFA